MWRRERGCCMDSGVYNMATVVTVAGNGVLRDSCWRMVRVDEGQCHLERWFYCITVREQLHSPKTNLGVDMGTAR